jgi:hypothetical protein
MLNFDLEEQRQRGQDQRRGCGVSVGQLAVIALGCLGIIGFTQLGAEPDSTVSTVERVEMKTEVMMGSSKDDHGCLSSAGFTYCEGTGECVRPWSDSCPGGTHFCQQYCAELHNNPVTVTCACSTTGAAVDYRPPECSDLREYDMTMLGACADGVKSFAVMGQDCQELPGCSKHLGAFSTVEECQAKCFTQL